MTRLIPLFLLLGACDGGEEKKTGLTTEFTGTMTEGSCEVISDEPIALDVQAGAPLNFSAENALGELTGVSNTTNVLTWPDEMTINVFVEFVHDGGEARFVERDAVGQLSPQDLSRCFTAIEIPGTLTFSSGDGAFDETFTGVTLQAVKRREGVLDFTVDQGSLNGSWTPGDSGLTDGTGYALEFYGDITNLGSAGTITVLDGDTEVGEAGIWAPPPTQG